MSEKYRVALRNNGKEVDVTDYVFRSLLATSADEVKNLPKDELKKAFFDYLGELSKRGESLKLLFDHKESLIEKAGSEKDVEVKAVLLATWFEHWINEVITSRAAQLGVSEKECSQIIRDTGNRAKLGWLLSLLGLPPLDSNIVKRINKLFEARNSFVHYKMYAEPPNYEKACGDFIDSIEYLERYYTDNILGGHDTL